MDWETIAAASEMVAALGVIVSLLYLARQVRSATDTARTSTYQAVVADFGALNRSMAESADLSDLFIQAMEDYDSLTPEERARISQVIFVCFHNFENMYYQYRKGYLEEDMWLGWKRMMLTYAARPGFQTYWKMRSSVFSQSFVDFLATEKLDRPVMSYFDVTRFDVR